MPAHVVDLVAQQLFIGEYTTAVEGLLTEEYSKPNTLFRALLDHLETTADAVAGFGSLGSDRIDHFKSFAENIETFPEGTAAAEAVAMIVDVVRKFAAPGEAELAREDFVHHLLVPIVALLGGEAPLLKPVSPADEPVVPKCVEIETQSQPAPPAVDEGATPALLTLLRSYDTKDLSPHMRALLSAAQASNTA